MSASRRSMSVAVAFSMLVALAFSGGCSSSGRAKESEKAVEGFQSTRAAIAKAQGQVDRTQAALNELSAGGDLQKSYKNYKASVADLGKTAEEARKRATAMRERVKEYTDKWQSEIENMNDPTIQAGLTQRREAVQKNFTNVRTAAQAAREAYDPYYKQLLEVEKALSLDLTPQNVTAIKPAIDKARTQGQTLKEKLTALEAQLETIASGMSPAGAAAPKK